MANNPVQLFVAAFEDEEQAGAALEDFQAVDRDGSIKGLYAAVIVRQ
jgi:hypothetical protein